MYNYPWQERGHDTDQPEFTDSQDLMEVSVDAPQKIVHQFDRVLKEVREAPSYGIDRHKSRLMGAVRRLAESEGGLEFLFSRIDDLLEVRIFSDSVWEDPRTLVASLAGGTLMAGGEAADFEVLSELRLLALANRRLTDDRFTPGEARTFLQKIIANNLEFLFPAGKEETRSLASRDRDKITRLFKLLVREIPIQGVKGTLLDELEMICAQRPVVTDRARQIIRFIRERFTPNSDSDVDRKLRKYIYSVYSPTRFLQEHPDMSPDQYAEYLEQAGEERLKSECVDMGKSMSSTGLTGAWHSALIRQVADQPARLQQLLDLNRAGKAELAGHKSFVRELIKTVINPSTHRAVYGLARLLERSLLSHQPVYTGLKRLLTLNVHPSVEKAILRSTLARQSENPDARILLTADTLNVLGQPLGVGQGWNPTCQSARGISLWSRHAPGKLLNMLITAASENNLAMRFEGTELNSGTLAEGLAKEFDYHLDMVSIVLVPHLDRIYNEMMRRCALRPDDGHRWVNPAMYGHWIPGGFMSAHDVATNSIRNYRQFVRTFYVTHHPHYNGGHDLAYPNPVGIFITSSTGKLLGFHAVSILRVAENNGQMRVYFLNPNNEGRQSWGPDLEPTVAGHGERHGESSLPFFQFAARLYAFHYLTADMPDPASVPRGKVDRITELARSSWGTSYNWIDE